MSLIKVNEYITTGFSADDADGLNKIIKSKLDKKEEIILDFEGIKIFTTLFFNNVLAKYLVELGPEKYDVLFKVVNLSEIGDATYEHSIENAKKYYNLNAEERKNQEELISEID